MLLGVIPNDILQNFKDVDKFSYLSLCIFQFRIMSVTGELGLYLCSPDGSNSAFSFMVQGYNAQCKYTSAFSHNLLDSCSTIYFVNVLQSDF